MFRVCVISGKQNTSMGLLKSLAKAVDQMSATHSGGAWEEEGFG